eukprot:567805-Rhodomonas_salina.1
MKGVRGTRADAQAGSGGGGGGGGGGGTDFNWWTEWYPMAPVQDLQVASPLLAIVLARRDAGDTGSRRRGPTR